MNDDGPSDFEMFETRVECMTFGIAYSGSTVERNRVQMGLEGRPEYQEYLRKSKIAQQIQILSAELVGDFESFFAELQALEQALTLRTIEIVARVTGEHPLGVQVPDSMPDDL